MQYQASPFQQPPRKGINGWAVAGITLGITALVLSPIAALAGGGNDIAAPTTQSTPATPQPDPTTEAPAPEPDPTDTEEPAEEDTNTSSFEDPFSYGTKLPTEDWELTIGKLDADATQRILNENMFNDKPEHGHRYVMAKVKVKYLGEDKYAPSDDITITYVGSDGNEYDKPFIVIPDPLDQVKPMRHGAKADGYVAAEVPKGAIKGGQWYVVIDGAEAYVDAA